MGRSAGQGSRGEAKHSRLQTLIYNPLGHDEMPAHTSQSRFTGTTDSLQQQLTRLPHDLRQPVEGRTQNGSVRTAGVSQYASYQVVSGPRTAAVLRRVVCVEGVGV
jgi:hypothetical protein